MRQITGETTNEKRERNNVFMEHKHECANLRLDLRMHTHAHAHTLTHLDNVFALLLCEDDELSKQRLQDELSGLGVC